MTANHSTNGGNLNPAFNSISAWVEVRCGTFINLYLVCRYGLWHNESMVVICLRRFTCGLAQRALKSKLVKLLTKPVRPMLRNIMQPSVVFVQTSLRSIPTSTTSGQYSLVRFVSNQYLIFFCYSCKAVILLISLLAVYKQDWI